MPVANSTPRIVTVYGLSSSRDGALRYIGQTVGALSARLRGHRHSACRNVTAVAKWIKRELGQGYAIVITPIEECAIWHLSEISWIAKHRADGARLLNLTDGGEGTVGWHGNLGNKRPDLAEKNRQSKGKPGHPSTPEINAKISAAHKGKKKPWLAERNRANAGKPGTPHTDEWKKMMSAVHKGKVTSDEAKRKISESRKRLGKKLSKEAISKLRTGHRNYFEKKRLHASILLEESKAK